MVRVAERIGTVRALDLEALGIAEKPEQSRWIGAVNQTLADWSPSGLRAVDGAGRFLVAHGRCWLESRGSRPRVTYLCGRRAGMNSLIRALPRTYTHHQPQSSRRSAHLRAHVVGPICVGTYETRRGCPHAPGDVLLIDNTGAYGRN